MSFPILRRAALSALALGAVLGATLMASPQANAVIFASQDTASNPGASKPLVSTGGVLSTNPSPLRVKFFFTPDALTLGSLNFGLGTGPGSAVDADLYIENFVAGTASGGGFLPITQEYTQARYKYVGVNGAEAGQILLQVDTLSHFLDGLDGGDAANITGDIAVTFYSDALTALNNSINQQFTYSLTGGQNPLSINGNVIGDNTWDFSGQFAAEVPEPGTVALLFGIGVTGALALRRRKK